MHKRAGGIGPLVAPPREMVIGSGVLAFGIGVALLRLLHRYRDEGPVGGYPDIRRRSD